MRRDIAVQEVNKPLVGSASGFSNANFQATPENVFNPMDVLSKFTGSVQSIMGEANANAFKQGQADQASDVLAIGNTVDSAAALIEDASWLTKESYTQGVKYQQYAEGQLETQQEIAKQAQLSLKAGDTMQMFSQKVKPFLAKQNKRIAELGLAGEAKLTALDQVVSYTVSAQKTYQSALEAEAEFTFQKGLAQEGAGFVDRFTNTQDVASVVHELDSYVTSVSSAAYSSDPTKAVDTVGKQLLGAITNFQERAVGASPLDAQRIDAAMGWMYNSDTAKQLPVKERGKIIEQLQKAQAKVHEFNFNQSTKQIQDAQVLFKTTGQFDSDFVNRAKNYVDTGELNQTISAPHARALRSQLATFYTAADKEAPTQYLNLNGTGIELDANGVNRTTAAKAALASTLAQHNGQPSGYFAAIEQGRLLGRPELIQQASKGAVSTFSAQLTMNDEQLAESGTGGLANNSFVAMGTAYRQLNSEGRFDQAAALLKGFDNDNQREAVRQLWSDPNNVPTLGTETSTRYEKLYSRMEANTSAVYNVTFTTDAIDDGVFGQASSQVGAEFGYNPSEEIKAIHLEDMQSVYHNAARPYFQANNIRFAQDGTGEGALNAMLQHGFIIPTKAQLLAITPNQRMAIGGGVQASDDTVKLGLNGLAEDMISSLGDVEKHLKVPGTQFALNQNKVDRENIHFTFSNNGVMANAYDDNGTNIGATKYYTYGDIRKLSTPAAGANAVDISAPQGVVRTAGVDFKVKADTGTFGSNTLRSDSMKHIFVQEGYHKGLKASDPKRPNVVTFGHGITPDAAMAVFQDKTKVQQFIESSKDPSSVEYQTMYNAFYDGYYKDFQKNIFAAGLPTPNEGMSAVTHKQAYLGLLDAHYHGGQGGADAMIRIYNLARTDKAAAMQELQRQPFYIKTGRDSGRKEFLMDSVRSIR